MPPWSPCGLGVDYLRSCYSTEMRFYTEDPRTCLVDWYFVDPATPVIPFATPFRSRNWDAGEAGWGFELGEVDGAPRPWRDGSKVGSAAGTNFCGDGGQWASGQAAPPDPPVPVDDVGTPLCCDRIAHVPLPPLIFDCPTCPNGLAPTYTLQVVGLGNGYCDCSVLNRTWTAKHAFTCYFETEAITTCGGRIFLFDLDTANGEGAWLCLLQSGEDPGSRMLFSGSVGDPLKPCRLTWRQNGTQGACFGNATDTYIDLTPGPHQPPARS